MATLAMALRILEQTIPLLGAGTDTGREVLSLTSRLAKLVSSGSGNQGVENTAMAGLQAQQRQMSPIIAQLRAQQAQGGGGAPPAQPMPAAA